MKKFAIIFYKHFFIIVLATALPMAYRSFIVVFKLIEMIISQTMESETVKVSLART